MPHLILIAGPNGAGKSTSAPGILRGALAVSQFVNADTIALDLSGFAPERAAIQAGRVMLTRLHQLAEEGDDFAFETTLASLKFCSLDCEAKNTRLSLPSCFLDIAQRRYRNCARG